MAITAFALVACKGNSDAATALAGGQPQMLSAVDPFAPAVSDLQMARAALAQGNMPLAMDHVSRQLDRAPDDGEALAILAKCVRTMADEACKRGDHLEALGLLGQLSARVDKAHAARFQPDAPVTALDDLVARERDVTQIGDSIIASADEQSRGHLNAAIGYAYDAYHCWKWNDRDKVRAGLRELRWVHDCGPALSKDFIGWYYQVLNQFKKLLTDSEWEPLRMEAGFVEKVAAQ